MPVAEPDIASCAYPRRHPCRACFSWWPVVICPCTASRARRARQANQPVCPDIIGPGIHDNESGCDARMVNRDGTFPALRPVMKISARERRPRPKIAVRDSCLRHLRVHRAKRGTGTRIMAAACLVFLSGGALRAADDLIATPVARQLNEKYVDEVPVSGQVLAGVGLGWSGDLVAADRLSIFIPGSHSGDRVCVQVISRDGRYWSKNTFILPEVRRAAYVALQYPSMHLDALRDIPAGDLAMLAFAGDCENTTGNELFVADWLPSPVAAPDHLQVFVNSGRADSYIITRDPDGKRNRAPCRRILDDRRTGYDTVCDLRPLPLMSTLQFEILRHHYEGTPRTERFRIRLKP